MNRDTFDYIVVGAGSAGAAAAARLSENPDLRVLLLDAGPPDGNIWSKIPLGVGTVLGRGIYLRNFHTEPDPQLNGRQIYWPRGWVLGGSSTVNGMIWVHGTPHLYDEWAADGCPGWAYADLLPWFRRIESFGRGDDRFRGHEGPVTITEFSPVDPLANAFLDALEASGVGRRVADYNAGGFGGSHLQFNTRRGVRCNTRMAYLDPAQSRANLQVLPNTLVTRLLLQEKRAVGVQALHEGREVKLYAKHEVILCGGTFNSTQLLELSGIGRREVLEAVGVPVVLELPMVGENLSEHVYSPMVYRTQKGVSWNRPLNSVLGKARWGARWLLRRDGPLSTNSITAQAFVAEDGQGTNADLKLQVQQVSSSNNRAKGAMVLDDFEGVTLASFQIRPHSRGTCHIASRDPQGDPRLVANHFTDARDIDACLNALRLSRRMAAAAPLSHWIEEELRPGPNGASDEALLAYLRATGATAYHPVGTCRIGSDAAQSVVDPQLRVHGMSGLRVADGSVMPTIASTNTNAICTVIGERVAEFIRQQRM
ncbi:GMC family oxidoreductase [Comamonas testosteroni]|uniref:GMC family oxidoreductase n=1 Tax=Comamonas testosteroni TaxID=285 RepID=UPI0015F7D2D3|nr:GMC family oxidoreductase N-terminal domain-containing protein [Comamonas testosteroni]WEE78187.1 GMC family oxidoreductase N-terminal domain-containing protein [Comamonas testosteroni]